MIRDIITNKWIIGAIVFLIVFGVVCVLWYRYDTAPYKQAASEAAEVAREWEATQKAEQAADTPMESKVPTTEKPTTEATTPDTVSEETEKKAAEVRVSPYGLGPYPKVPKEWKFPNLWATVKSKNEELLERVHIKAWNDGKRYSSIGMEADV